MSTHRSFRFAPLLAALLVLTLLPPATPAGLAVQPGSPTLTSAAVSGNVLLPGGAPAGGAVIWFAPLTAVGAFDWTRAESTIAFSGFFSFVLAAPGQYGLEIEPPNNDTSAQLLQGYSFTLAPGAASLDLGSITLPAAAKRISGSLTFPSPGGSVGLQGVPIYAVNSAEQIYLSNTTDASGLFGFGVTAGEWEVYTSNQPGASWQVTAAPVQVTFADNAQPETASVPLVAARTTGILRGRVLGPDGQAITPAGGSPLPYVYATGQNSYAGRFEVIDSTGAFTMPVVADTYTLEVVVDPESYPDLSAPPPATTTIVSGTLVVPTITLQRNDAGISGVVRDAGGPLADVDVQAYSDDGRYHSARTAADGSYSLKLTEGDWTVEVFPDAASGYLQQNDFARVYAPANQPITQDFTLVRAAAVVSGSFVEAAAPAAPLVDVNGWAYARDEAGEFVAWGPVEEGSFSLSVPPGAYSVGVELAPGSPYAAPAEASLAVGPTQTWPPASRSVTITLRKNDAVISGVLRDATTNQPITGVPVVVAVTPRDGGGAYQWAGVDASTGAFSIAVAPGDWDLSYFIEEPDRTTYAVPWADPISLSVPAGGSARADIFLAQRDGIIAGTLTSGGAPLAGKLVWVSSQAYADSALSGPDGRYSISVPTRGPGGQELSYIISTDFACVIVADCYYDIEPRRAVVARPGTNLRPAQELGNNIDANPVGSNGADLLGLVVNTSGQPLSGQSVRNGSRGGVASANTVGNVTSGAVITRGENRYNFSLPITYPRGGRPTRVSGRIKIAGSSFPIDTAIDGSLRAGPAALAQSDVVTLVVDPNAGLPVVPPAEFEARNGFTTTLTDGTRIEIPPGAVPLEAGDRGAAGQGLVRVTITPTYNLFATRQFGEAGRYGFEVALTAVASNRPITQELLAPMRITLRYSGVDIVENAIRESQLRGARRDGQEWSPADSFVVDQGANEVTFQTTRLGLWALVQLRSACGQCLFLPSVGK